MLQLLSVFLTPHFFFSGDLVIDLLWESCPKSCTNFIKLCKLKYFNYTPIPIVRKDKLVYLGDKSNGTNSSIWGFSSNKSSSKFFTPELQKPGSTDITFKERGTVAFTTVPSKGRDGFKHEDLLADSQFCITVTENYEPDTELAIFGNVVEGFETLDKLNNAVTDFSGKPLLPILILHSYVLDDPFEEEDSIGVLYPEESPPPSPGQLELIEEAFNQDELSTSENKGNNTITSDNNRSVNTVKTKSDRDAAAQALTLEIIGDLPFAAVKPEENILFVCKLNPVTQADDLELIFSRFGKILSCEVIRDPDTGDSLQYAFIEFDRQEDCERAYLKMEGVLIDDRRIHVDFSQSVSKLAGAWRNKSNEKRRSVHGARFQASTGSSRRNHQRSPSPPLRESLSSLHKKRNDNDQRSDRGREISRKDHYNDKYRNTSRQSDNDRYDRDRYNTSHNSDKSRHKNSHRDRDDRRHYDKDTRSHRDKDHRSSHRDQDRYNRSSRDRSSGLDDKRDRKRDREDRSSRDRDRDRDYRSSRRDSDYRSSRDRDSKSSNNNKGSSDHRKESSSRW